MKKITADEFLANLAKLSPEQQQQVREDCLLYGMGVIKVRADGTVSLATPADVLSDGAPK